MSARFSEFRINGGHWLMTVTVSRLFESYAAAKIAVRDLEKPRG